MIHAMKVTYLDITFGLGAIISAQIRVGLDIKDGRMYYLVGKSIHLFQHLHTQQIYWQMQRYKDTFVARTMLQATCRLIRVIALEVWKDKHCSYR